MPVFRSGEGQAPAWCELEYFEIVTLAPGETHSFARRGPREKLIVGGGACRIAFDGRSMDATARTNLDLASGNAQFEVLEVAEETTLIRMCGRWGDETGGSGVFGVDTPEEFKPRGDDWDYPKETNFDNHYHDCDEYWIIFEGRGVAVSEGKSFEVGPGDCVATGMGHHHDFPMVHEPVKSVYFETTMEGRKRRGHLWNKEHGPVKPMMDRV